MTPEQEERLVAAFEQLAVTFMDHHLAMFPPKRTPAEATISKVKSPEDKLREQQGSTRESLGEWTSLGEGEEEALGEREKEWVRRNSQKNDGEAPF